MNDLPPATVGDLFQSLGRVEAKVDNLGGLDNRLRTVEIDVHTLKEASGRKAPWWIVVGSIVGVITGLGGLIGILTFMAQLLDVVSTLK